MRDQRDFQAFVLCEDVRENLPAHPSALQLLTGANEKPQFHPQCPMEALATELQWAFAVLSIFGCAGDWLRAGILLSSYHVGMFQALLYAQ